jgi:4-hydroxy-2-oxoheptanedioate aldolase
MKPNRMKQKLQAGEPVYGVSVMIPSPQIVEMIAAAGFDWVLLDCEHGTLTLESVELMAMAAEASGITAIARPMTKSAEHILQVLDRGVMGVQVPHVNTAEEARAVIAAVKYHPAGSRGLAAGTRAANYDAHGTLADYVLAANEATLIAIQLEDRPAIDNIDALLAVDGIDVFFIGPSDLSQSMGHPGNPKAPEVAQAIQASLRKMVAAGRTPGMPATAENLRGALDQGVRYIYTHLPRLLAGSARDYLAKAKGGG